MNNNKYKIGFFVLLVINIVLVAVFSFRPRIPMRQGGIKEEISIELGFTEEQRSIFDGLANNHRESIHALDKEEQELVRSFFSQLSSDQSNENQEIQIREILQLEREKIMVTYHHFEELKALCNEEQLSKFNRVMERIVPVLTNTSGRPMQPHKPPF